MIWVLLISNTSSSPIYNVSGSSVLDPFPFDMLNKKKKNKIINLLKKSINHNYDENQDETGFVWEHRISWNIIGSQWGIRALKPACYFHATLAWVLCHSSPSRMWVHILLSEIHHWVPAPWLAATQFSKFTHSLEGNSESEFSLSWEHSGNTQPSWNSPWSSSGHTIPLIRWHRFEIKRKSTSVVTNCKLTYGINPLRDYFPQCICLKRKKKTTNVWGVILVDDWEGFAKGKKHPLSEKKKLCQNTNPSLDPQARSIFAFVLLSIWQTVHAFKMTTKLTCILLSCTNSEDST